MVQSTELLTLSQSFPREVKYAFLQLVYAIQLIHLHKIPPWVLSELTTKLIDNEEAEKLLVEEKVVGGQTALVWARQQVEQGLRLEARLIMPTVIRKPDEIVQLPIHTLILHTASPEIMSRQKISQILARCSFLQIITYPPSLSRWFSQEMSSQAAEAGVIVKATKYNFRFADHRSFG